MDKTRKLFSNKHLHEVSPQGSPMAATQDAIQPYSITRYRKTRYWAIWKGTDELLAVTVYLRGARAVLEQLNNPSTHMTTTHQKAGTVILAAKNHEGLSVRLRCTLEATEVSHSVRGEWKTDLSYDQPLPELLNEGLFRLTSAKGRKSYRSFFPHELGRRKKHHSRASKQKDDVRKPPVPLPAPPEPPLCQHPAYNVVLTGDSYARPIPEGYLPSPGDRLLRLYKKNLVEVRVKAPGQYEWNGQVYPTLTHISWKVTGYQISGNAFFGLPVKHRCK